MSNNLSYMGFDISILGGAAQGMGSHPWGLGNPQGQAALGMQGISGINQTMQGIHTPPPTLEHWTDSELADELLRRMAVRGGE